MGCSGDLSGQKYEFRETDLRLNRNRGNGTPKPFLTVSNSGMLVMPFIFSCFLITCVLEKKCICSECKITKVIIKHPMQFPKKVLKKPVFA